ncbi:MAG: ornithine carbamoyltransferase [Candidatus Omnitrophota bacterium]|nr:ornithine carbamoyltransferase [Candidatus Omnitrophota bacterium]
MKKDFISIKDLTEKEITDIFALTSLLKKNKARFNKVLAGKTLALIFQKPSNRTRVSFEVGMYQLGGNSIYLAPHEINLGVRESIKDAAMTLSRYVDAIVLRTFAHKDILEMAKYAAVPVINGLTDLLHPCQAMADIYTLKEKLKNIKGKVLSYMGDGNNVCNSLLYACARSGLNIRVAAPEGFAPDKTVFKEAAAIAKSNKVSLNLFSDPCQAASGADVIYTDVWTSMGQEKESKERKKIFKDFQVNKELIKLAKKDVLIMHCLPAHRGEEITDEVIESKNSVIFDQAENRMHAQKAILIKLLKK